MQVDHHELEEIRRRYRRRADIFERTITGVAPERWSDPSPCEDWTAREVVQHALDMHEAMLRPFGRSLDQAPSVGEDPLGAFQAARRDIEAVLDDPDLAATESRSPAGVMPVAAHIDAVASEDLIIHRWDLARATGQDDTIDPDEVERLWAALEEMPADLFDKLHTPGAYGPGVVVYGPEVEVAADAPLQHQLLGRLGRDPYWGQ